MKTICLIRHAKTQGNVQHSYIGRTDEPLCEQGRMSLAERIGEHGYPDSEIIFSSPMRRCLETAQLIYPERKLHQIADLRECDFGDFEGKTYSELQDNPAYRDFLDSNGKGIIPGGESTARYKQRCITAFLAALHSMEEAGTDTASVICHGGTIMAILEAYDCMKKDFYDYQVENCGGYRGVFDWDKMQFVSLKKI